MAEPCPVRLDAPIRFVKGVGPHRAERLARLGVTTIADGLYFLPRRHEDRTHLTPIRDVRPGAIETVAGSVLGTSLIRTRRGMPIFELRLGDGTGVLTAKWFNQPYLARRFRPGQRLILSGRPTPGLAREMANPEAEILEEREASLHVGRVVPIYPLTNGLSQRQMRVLMKDLVDAHGAGVPEFLPEAIRRRQALAPLAAALRQAHFPSTLAEGEAARRRLAFDDLFLLALGLALRRRGRGEEPGTAFPVPSPRLEAARAQLPFALTPAQERVLAEILADMSAPVPMNRLLQGEVGSGKTIVALLATLVAVDAGMQAALMVPTEILAEQHWRRARSLLEPLGVPTRLLTGGIAPADRRRAEAALGQERPGLFVGTHALAEGEVAFGRLGLAVIDEQHRFGVRQRAAFRAKGPRPDVLVMTATPIPRTLSLTLYGDLDCSILDEVPPGRRPPVTERATPSDRPRIYARIREEVRRGHRAYVICPLIEAEEGREAQAAIRMAEDLARGPLRGIGIGLLHGRLPWADKEAVMRAFAGGDTPVLVSTTVVEVGVDVPEATVMVIEGAERLGLSQLHQLRGRVGRGPDPALCVLIAERALSPEAEARLQALVEEADGFRLAERDLALRGPGDLFGLRQSGLPDLRIADLIRDRDLLEAARREADAVVAGDPSLDRPDYRDLRAALAARWAGRLELARVG